MLQGFEVDGKVRIGDDQFAGMEVEVGPRRFENPQTIGAEGAFMTNQIVAVSTVNENRCRFLDDCNQICSYAPVRRADVVTQEADKACYQTVRIERSNDWAVPP